MPDFTTKKSMKKEKKCLNAPTAIRGSRLRRGSMTTCLKNTKSAKKCSETLSFNNTWKYHTQVPHPANAVSANFWNYCIFARPVKNELRVCGMSVLEFVESKICLQLNCHQVIYVFLQGKAKTAIKAISMPKFSNREDGRTICLICVRDFVDLSNARRHYREKHEERKELFECSYCNKKFAVKRSLTDHMLRKHKISQKMLRNSIS